MQRTQSVVECSKEVQHRGWKELHVFSSYCVEDQILLVDDAMEFVISGRRFRRTCCVDVKVFWTVIFIDNAVKISYTFAVQLIKHLLVASAKNHNEQWYWLLFILCPSEETTTFRLKVEHKMDVPLSITNLFLLTNLRKAGN
jgi:hypothetical protein